MLCTILLPSNTPWHYIQHNHTTYASSYTQTTERYRLSGTDYPKRGGGISNIRKVDINILFEIQIPFNTGNCTEVKTMISSFYFCGLNPHFLHIDSEIRILIPQWMRNIWSHSGIDSILTCICLMAGVPTEMTFNTTSTVNLCQSIIVMTSQCATIMRFRSRVIRVARHIEPCICPSALRHIHGTT